MDAILAMGGVEAGVFVFLLGLLIVFFGMTIIVLVISIIGKIMKTKDAKKKAKPVETAAEALPVAFDEEEDKRVVAAIMAAISAFYVAEGNDCEFKVKRIKRV